ncbi:Cytochrome b subunit [Candidatus Hydrogenisulfobacillus filiaventi]|uniref:Cytochrome b subunit n=1 Tax=Candidatus Hydrogenisulfobacillus filiaventi TaxID=2707344 RepID=A0A6F8ZG47_9FIRM|nr:Cytochrome b subunit [Candidatus Hydrogenisulfobacillus filiaventi]
MSKQTTPREEFSVTVRWMHWIRFALIMWLIATGFEIANPYLGTNPNVTAFQNFTVELVRGSHELAGLVLIAALLIRVYTMILNREWRDGKVALSWKRWRSQLAYYLLLGPAYRHGESRYGPLQFVTYMIFYVMLVLISVTGLLLFGANYKAGGIGYFSYHDLGFLYPVFGGLAGARIWHHWLAWGIIVFVAVHVYMAFWNSIENKDGTLESMVVGYKREQGDETDLGASEAIERAKGG